MLDTNEMSHKLEMLYVTPSNITFRKMHMHA